MLTLLTLLACVKMPAPSLPSVSPGNAVWLRSSFDADASPYVGRFIPQGTRALDDSAAMQLACSKFITTRFVDGGGVKMVETFQASTEVGARLGVPLVVDAKGSGSGSQQVRVEYTLTGKLIADITDPAAFAACCKATPDQCTDRYVGEFLQGTGAVLTASSRKVEAGVEASHAPSGTGGDVSVKNSADWNKTVEFPNPVYFAFKVTKTPFNLQTSACPTWVTTPPPATDGLVLVGRSKEVKTDDAARKGALSDAEKQLWKATGASLQDAGTDAAAGTGLQARDWCVEARTAENGDVRYVGHVLANVPQATIDAMRRGAAARQAEMEKPVTATGTAAAPAPAQNAPHVGNHPATTGRTPPPPQEAPARGTTGRTPPPAPNASLPALGAAFTDADVNALVAALRTASFSSDKLAVVQGYAGRRMTTAQAARVLRGFSFSADQLAALGVLAPGLTNRADKAPILEVFSFSADKAAAEAMLR
jgi:hypothetical protein